MFRLKLMVLLTLTLIGCGEPVDLVLPSSAEIEAHYLYEGRLGAEVKGNVAVVTVGQSARQLGVEVPCGRKLALTFFLFSEETQQLLNDYPSLAAVRVITVVGESEVANVLLGRDALSDIQWRRALNIAGRARVNGTQRVTLLQDLVRWGEDHAEEYNYNPRYARSK
ncbi:MAG: hypothetical protein Ct9H300mP15_04780 [Gemmatimonadota bacterium]|nr:MAG: hypothetical protein Ct9H300mP15_04780 [Gemmatimonadota bacterium]